MKLALGLVLVGIASALASPILFRGAVEVEEFVILKNAIDELILEFSEYVRWLLIRHEPYPFPDLPTQTLVDDDVNIKFSTGNVLISKAETFKVDKLSNNLPALQSIFGFTIPTAHLEGEYVVTGVAFGKDVKGAGKFSVDATNFVVTGSLQYTIADHSLQIETLKPDYTIGEAKFDVQGLKVEGLSSEEINEFLNKEFLSYLQNNKAFVLEKVSNHVIEIVNKILYGHSLQDTLNFIKQLVASTPDPPPFPTLSTQQN